MKIVYYRNTTSTTNIANAHVVRTSDFNIGHYTNDVDQQNILRKTYYFLDTNTGENPILYTIGKLVQRVVNYHGEQEWVFTNKKVMIIIPDLLIENHLFVRRTNSPKQATVKRHAAQPTQQVEAAAQYGGTSARSKRSTRSKRSASNA